MNSLKFLNNSRLVTALILLSSLTLAMAVGYFDEGINNFSFLTDPSSLLTVFILASLLSSISFLAFLKKGANRNLLALTVHAVLIVSLSIIMF